MQSQGDPKSKIDNENHSHKAKVTCLNGKSQQLLTTWSQCNVNTYSSTTKESPFIQPLHAYIFVSLERVLMYKGQRVTIPLQCILTRRSFSDIYLNSHNILCLGKCTCIRVKRKGYMGLWFKLSLKLVYEVNFKVQGGLGQKFWFDLVDIFNCFLSHHAHCH